MEPVDVITGGSPCQDLSVAGKRAGLAGERSGLFMEQIRLTKELRDADRKRGRSGVLIRPRYFIWENVPGAFSSNGGADFQAVLTETIRIAEPDAPDVPLPEKGKWPMADAYYGDGWSVAYRVLDAQFWGVPQRRRRIALVADFGGLSAPEILFERKGLSGDFEPGETSREEAAGTVGSGADSTVYAWTYRGRDGGCNVEMQKQLSYALRNPSGGGSQANILISKETQGALNPWDSQSARVYSADGVWHSLNANENGGQSRDSVFCLQGNCIDRADTAGCNGKGWTEDVSYTLNTIDRPAVCAGFSMGQSEKARSIGYQEEVSPTLRGGEGGNQKPCVLSVAQNQLGEVRTSDVSGTLNTNSNATGRNSPLVYDGRGRGDGKIVPTMCSDHFGRPSDFTALCVGNGQLNQISMAEQANTLDTMHDQQAIMCAAVDCRNGTENAEINGTLQAKSNGGFNLNSQNVCRQGAVVRRLTPLECERLQGYPDGWTQIGELMEFKVNDYETVFVEPDDPEPRPEDFGIEVGELWEPDDPYDVDYEDDSILDKRHDAYYASHAEWEKRAYKRAKVGSHIEVDYAWTDSKGKKHRLADSGRYKALGNSIALPSWQWLARRICAQYERDITMASLFDGISGFPYVFEHCGAKAVWASEIEEFCIAVSKYHFPEKTQ